MLTGFATLGLVLWIVPIVRGSAAAWGWSGTGNQVVSVCLWACGFALFASSFAPPPLATKVYIAWMSMVTPVGVIMSVVVLSLLFALLLPIFSFIVRFADPLRKRLGARATYWEDYKPYEPTLERMKRPF